MLTEVHNLNGEEFPLCQLLVPKASEHSFYHSENWGNNPYLLVKVNDIV